MKKQLQEQNKTLRDLIKQNGLSEEEGDNITLTNSTKGPKKEDSYSSKELTLKPMAQIKIFDEDISSLSVVSPKQTGVFCESASINLSSNSN